MGRPFESSQCDDNKHLASNNQADATNRNHFEQGKRSKIKTGKGNDAINSFHIHTNFHLVHQLIEIVRKNYPERLAKALIVPNGGWEKLLGTHGLRRFIPSPRTRQKIHMLDSMDDLIQFATKDQLSALVGGDLPIDDIQ